MRDPLTQGKTHVRQQPRLPSPRVMFRRVATILLLTAAFTAPAQAQGTQLMPGVTYEKTVEFTPHGAVVLHVITAPRPGDQNGLYQLAPVLAHGTVLGGLERATQIEKDVSASATVAANTGAVSRRADAPRGGVFTGGGALLPPPLGA